MVICYTAKENLYRSHCALQVVSYSSTTYPIPSDRRIPNKLRIYVQEYAYKRLNSIGGPSP